MGRNKGRAGLLWRKRGPWETQQGVLKQLHPRYLPENGPGWQRHQQNGSRQPALSGRYDEASGLSKARTSLIQVQRRDVHENPSHVEYPILGTRLGPLRMHLAGLALFLLLLQGHCKHRPKEAISSDIRHFVLDQHGCPLPYLQQPPFARQGLLDFLTLLNRKLLGTEL